MRTLGYRAFLAILFLFTPHISTATPPNVLLIMTDDQGWGDVRSHGNDRIDTPTMDRIAKEGVRFNRFFVSPVCAPTRASLLTGRDHLRTGTVWVTRNLETMRSEEVTLAEVFRANGYATGCFGKWHNGAHYPHHPNGQGFDEFFGFCAGHWNNYFDTVLERNGEPVQTEGYISDVLTDEALSFIERNRDSPFFCYVPYNAPHSPFQVPDKYFDKYKQRGLDDKNACVYGMVEYIDDNIGKMLGLLEDLDLSDQTIVLFLTDNGPNGRDRYNGGMKGAKASVHEGGVRVPLFIRWPEKIAPGTEVEQIAAHIDILPTLVELCGLPTPSTLPLDGRTLVPLMRGETEGWPDRTLFTHHTRRGEVHRFPASVRTQTHRMIVTEGGTELYNLVDDPGQETDLSADQPDIVQSLENEYEDWFVGVTKDLEGRLPLPVGYPEWPKVTLPAHEATIRGGVTYHGRAGWANDWITNLTSSEDSIVWNVDVVKSGTFEVSLGYICMEKDVGTSIEVSASGIKAEAVLQEAHSPEPIPSPDRVDRGEVYEKEWASLSLGNIWLDEGVQDLEVRASNMSDQATVDLKFLKLARSN